MVIEPLNEFILIEVDPSNETTDTGIVIAGKQGDKTDAVAIKGTVKALPEGLKVAFKVGERVLVSKWEGQKAYIEATEYLLVKNQFICGRIKNER